MSPRKDATDKTDTTTDGVTESVIESEKAVAPLVVLSADELRVIALELCGIFEGVDTHEVQDQRVIAERMPVGRARVAAIRAKLEEHRPA